MTISYPITRAHTQADRCVNARNWLLSPLGAAQAARLARWSWWESVTRVALSTEAKTRLTVAPVFTHIEKPDRDSPDELADLRLNFAYNEDGMLRLPTILLW